MSDAIKKLAEQAEADLPASAFRRLAALFSADCAKRLLPALEDTPKFHRTAQAAVRAAYEWIGNPSERAQAWAYWWHDQILEQIRTGRGCEKYGSFYPATLGCYATYCKQKDLPFCIVMAAAYPSVTDQNGEWQLARLQELIENMKGATDV